MSDSNTEQDVTYVIKPTGPLTLGVRELVHYRDLFYFFTWRDIKVKYKQTVLGFAWTLLQPLTMMILFTVFFARAVAPTTHGLPYPVFVFSGLLLWMLFSSGLANAGNSMVSNANMIKKIYFPRLIIPISSVLVALFDFLMALPVFVVLLIWYGCVPQWQALFYIPAALVLTLLAATGAGCLLAALTVKYRDFRYVLPFLIQLLLFATPVIFPPNYLSQPGLQKLLMLNPMSGAITLFRGIFAHQPIDWTMIGWSSVSAIFLFVIGIFYFRKTESYFADLA